MRRLTVVNIRITSRTIVELQHKFRLDATLFLLLLYLYKLCRRHELINIFALFKWQDGKPRNERMSWMNVIDGNSRKVYTYSV